MDMIVSGISGRDAGYVGVPNLWFSPDARNAVHARPADVHHLPMIQSAVPAWLPDPRDLRRLSLRGALLWLGVRAGVVACSLLSLVPRGVVRTGSILELTPPAATAVVLIVAGAATLEARRRRETLFAANLGWHPAWPAGVAAVVGGVLELGMARVV